MKSLCILCFASVDPSLGKIDKASLSQETLLELFIDNIENKEAICGSEDNPKDILDWEGLGFNADGDITKIRSFNLSLRGPVDLQWIPETVETVVLCGNQLSGTVDLTCLPDDLCTLNLGSNRLEGTIDLTRLPGKMETLLLDRNCFSGRADFSMLPESLRALNITENRQLEGEVYHFRGALMKENTLVKDMRDA